MARDLRLFYLFRLLATSYLWVPIFWHFLVSRGLGFDQIMLLSAIYSVTVIIVEVPTGALADRIGRRVSMMAGALAMVASCVVAYFAHSVPVFIVAEVLAATSMSLCSGADSAYLFDLLQEHGRGHEYARREGTASAWHQAGSAAAFAAGGLLGEINLALPYLVTAGVAGLAFFVAVFMGRDPRPHSAGPIREEVRTYARHMGQSFRDVRKNHKLMWILGYSAVVFVLLRATVYLYQPYLDARSFGIAETGFVFAVVYLVASFVAHHGDFLRRRFGERTLVWAVLATLAASFLVLSQVAGEWALMILGVQAVTNGLYSPLVKPMLNREISHSGRRATILSIESIVRRAAFGVFSPVVGFFGAATAIYVCGIFGFAAMLALFFAAGHYHRAPAVPQAVATGASAPATLD
ncbi:MAG: MFS transporter [Deltaproteobacteria bacterium]|nr:MFS transporter [Deltaproteobacteria bacterium]